jgi:hypothetical protein
MYDDVLWAVQVFIEPTGQYKGVLAVFVRGRGVGGVQFGPSRRNRKDAFKRAERLAIRLAAE